MRVAIPHFCAPTASGGRGHASLRSGESLQRAVALGRCLGGVLALARSQQEDMLAIDRPRILSLPPVDWPPTRLAGLQVDLHVFVQGDQCLQPVLEPLLPRLTLHRLNLEDPLELPAAARAFLLGEGGPGADLVLYLEDDLVIADPLYADKLLWFAERTGHRAVLMPHRFELTGSAEVARLFIDGPINRTTVARHQNPVADVARGRFWNGQEVRFDVASNPHAGTFALTAPQRERVCQEAPDPVRFVGPLETVATGTLLGCLPVWKPAWACREFLLLEHAHPSFLRYRQTLPRG